MRVAALILLVVALAPGLTNAAQYKKFDDCVVGKRVQDQGDKTGTIVKLDPSESLCMVLIDGESQPQARIFWMLRDAGASQVTNDKLVAGTYACYTNTSGTMQYTFTDVTIEGPIKYRTAGGKGKYSLDPKSGRIVFENGPLVKARGQLQDGPSIGLNMNGENFFNTSCSRKQ